MPHLLKANLYYGWANQLLKQRFRIPPLCWKKIVFFNFASLRRFQMIQWKKKQKYNIKGRQNLITFMSPKSIWELKDQTKLWQMLPSPMASCCGFTGSLPLLLAGGGMDSSQTCPANSNNRSRSQSFYHNYVIWTNTSSLEQTQVEKLTLAFILGRRSAFAFLTWYLIFFENSRLRRFSLYRRTLASLTVPAPVASGKRSMSANLACKIHIFMSTRMQSLTFKKNSEECFRVHLEVLKCKRWLMKQ